MAEKMNPAIKAEWVAALCSGEYKQATGNLRRDDGFCCLGVLCDLYAKAHGIHAWKSEDLGMEAAELPNRDVRMWAQLPSENPVLLAGGGETNLTALNDGGTGIEPRTFAQIAAAIEEQL